jgi:type III secretion system IpaD/SipD/SspD family effector
MEGIVAPQAYPVPPRERPHLFDPGTPPAAAPRNERETRVKSDAELWRTLAVTIDKTQANTVDIHHKMLERYTAFYKEVTGFKARLRTYISAGSDHNHIDVDIGKINYELQALRQRWRDAIVFGPAPLKQANQWSDEWNLPLASYEMVGDVSVVIDVAPLDAMIKATSEIGKTYNYYDVSAVPGEASQKANWLAAEHHAWDTAMGEQHRQIETKVNTLAEQNNHTLSTFNNLTKTLSASINAMFESLVNYFRGL